MPSDRSLAIPVALVITDLSVGGAERSLTELVKGLDRTRFHPVVYCLMPEPTGEQATLAEELRRSGIEVQFLNARSWLSAPGVVYGLWRRLRRQQARVVQSYLFHANFVAAIAAWLAGVPRIFTGIRVAEPRKWHLRLARWTDRFVTCHVCVSQAVAEYSENIAGLPRQKLHVIHNGIDVERFAGTQPMDLISLGVPPQRRVITFVGRLDAQKGLGWLLHLASRVFLKFPQHDLMIVGHGPAQDVLQKVVDELRIRERVHFVGWRSNIPAILAASDVLVLPSQWEGMPNVLLEAMAAAKPVVASNVEGVGEILGPLQVNQAFSPDNGDEFIEKLSRLLENSHLSAEIGAKNRQRVRSEFSLQEMCEKYDRLYRGDHV